MMDINMTPLIDVMLVLLIMLIITIPPQTHAVKLDLPVNQPNQPPPPIDPVKNTCVDQRAGPGAVERLAGHHAAAAPLSRHDAADEPDSGASPAAGRDGALRARRRGARRHQAGARPEDGLRRQRILS